MSGASGSGGDSVEQHSYLPPTHRRLRIFAYDPDRGRMPLHRITIPVPFEELKPGPAGARVKVIDWDGINKTFYRPVNLDDPYLLMQDGLDPSESDPRFHQQMAYAVASKVIENFDVALGRRVQFRQRKPLRLFPHAFLGPNAYYSPYLHGVLFGYFPADRQRPGSNLPGQTVYTCLSHDIIAHEVTHALTHRLRRYFLNPTNPDVIAFHEAFADIVAIFQHFSFFEILKHTIQETRGNLRENTPMVLLAEQFGYATGSGKALRMAVDKPDPGLIATVTEPHARGSILVAAIFDAFFRTYRNRTEDLVRIATGGTGRLPEGALHPDLVNRLATEACEVAQATLRICIRAFDYLPPIDITFGDYLRALVTADSELNPEDNGGLRREMVEAFRIRGILPIGVTSLSEDSLRWQRVDSSNSEKFPEDIVQLLSRRLMRQAAMTSRNSNLDPADRYEPDVGEAPTDIGKALREWAFANCGLLKLDPRFRIRPVGFHSAFRVGQDGQLLVEVVAQFVQRAGETGVRGSRNPRLFQAHRGGTTVIARADGRIRYVVSKPLESAEGLDPECRAQAVRRIGIQDELSRELENLDPFPTAKGKQPNLHLLARHMDLAAVHRRSR